MHKTFHSLAKRRDYEADQSHTTVGFNKCWDWWQGEQIALALTLDPNKEFGSCMGEFIEQHFTSIIRCDVNLNQELSAIDSSRVEFRTVPAGSEREGLGNP